MTAEFPERGVGAIISPEAAGRSFDVLLATPAAQLAVFAEWLGSGLQNLSLSSEDCEKKFEAFSKKRRVKDPQRILREFFQLESMRRVLGWDPAKFVRFLRDQLEEGQKLSDRKRKSLDQIEAIFSLSNPLDLLYKALRVYDGAVPCFVECYSLCDFRPIYDESRSQIVGGLLSATLQVTVRKPGLREGLKDLSFQLDMIDLDALIDELKRIRKKTAALRELFEHQLVNPLPLLNPRDAISGPK